MQNYYYLAMVRASNHKFIDICQSQNCLCTHQWIQCRYSIVDYWVILIYLQLCFVPVYFMIIILGEVYFSSQVVCLFQPVLQLASGMQDSFCFFSQCFYTVSMFHNIVGMCFGCLALCFCLDGFLQFILFFYLCSSELKCLYLCLISISVFPAAVDCPGMLISTMSRVQTPVGKSVPGSLHLMVTVCSPDVY